MAEIVKRRGKKEKYDERKVYASCFYACKTIQMEEKKCELICSKVSKTLTTWVKKQKDLNSDMIFEKIEKELGKHNKDAAFMYKTHRDVN